MRARCLRSTECSPITSCEYCVGDFDIRFDEKTRFCPFPPDPQGIQLVCHGKSRHLVCRFSRDGKAQPEQQPLPNLPIAPVARAKLGVHRSVRQSVVAETATSNQEIPPSPIRKRGRLEGTDVEIS